MAALDSRRDEFARLPAVLLLLLPLSSWPVSLLAEIRSAWRTVSSGPLPVRGRPQATAWTILHADFSSMSTPFLSRGLAVAGIAYLLPLQGHDRGALCSQGKGVRDARSGEQIKCTLEQRLGSVFYC